MGVRGENHAAGVTPDPILQIASGFMAAKHLFIANEIGLFDALATGPSSLDALEERTGVPRRTVRILANTMITFGVLERREDQYCFGPDAASVLSGGHAGDLRPLLRFWNHLMYPAYLKFEDVVRLGRAPTRIGHFTPEEQQIFSEGVEAFTAGQARALASTYDFGRHRRVMDLGGGTGSFLVAILRLHPHLEATLYELPTVVPVAQRRLKADPATARVEVVGGDLFADPIPSDHDVAILAHVIHVFSPERNRELLRRIRQAMTPGARLLLVDLWTDPTHTKPAIAPLMAGLFLVTTGEGDVYSEEELREWLQATGWRTVGRGPLDSAASLIVAEAAG